MLWFFDVLSNEKRHDKLPYIGSNGETLENIVCPIWASADILRKFKPTVHLPVS